MRPAFAFFFACAVFLSSAGVGRAEPPERVSAAALPQAGETVTIAADAAMFDWRGLREFGARVGDPDDERFEMDCQMVPPFTVSVLGGFETTVVLRYETPKRQREFFGCKNNGVLTVSLNGWAELKKAEAEIAVAKAAKERRRTTVRDIVKGATPEKVK